MNKLNLLIVLLAFAINGHANSKSIEFSNGWIKQLPPVVPMRAAYLVINNPSKQHHAITAIQSPAFARVEMHETRLVGDVMRMVELSNIPLAAKAVTELKPGGKHLMLHEPQQPLVIGDQIEITINFADGSSRKTMLEIRE